MKTRDRVIILLTDNPKGLTVQQVKVALGLNSVSLSSYHLNNLVVAGDAKKYKNRKYKLVGSDKSELLINRFKIIERKSALETIIASTYKVEQTQATVFTRDMYTARLDELKLITGLK